MKTFLALAGITLVAITALAANLKPPGAFLAVGTSTTAITIHWIDQTTGESGTRIERAVAVNGPWIEIAVVAANATNYVDATLSPTTTRYYRARTYQNVKQSAYSNVASGTTLGVATGPGAPTGLTATPISSTQINLAWVAPVNTGVGGIAGYKIYRNGSQIATTASTSYNNTGLTLATQYCYTVSAYDTAANNSPLTASVCATTFGDTIAPTVPTGLLVNAVSGTQISLSWTASTDTGGSGISGYKIYLSGSLTAVTSATTYMATGLTPSVQYCFTVAAYDGAGNTSFQSISLCATTPPLPDTIAPTIPAGLSSIANSSTVVSLSWSASTDTGGSGLAGYKVYRAGSQIDFTPLLVYTNTGLTPSTTYCYTVAAYDGAGNTSAQSAQSCATTPSGADTTAPSVPSGVAATAASSTQIDIVWNPSTDAGGSLLAGYRLYRGGTLIVTTTLTNYSNGGLAPSTQYCYSVIAFDGAGNASANSTTNCATTSADSTAPSVPIGLVAAATQTNIINLSWNPSTDTGGSGLLGYRIYTNSVLFTTNTTTSYSHLNLAYTTQYCYRVAALDAAGNASAQSLQSCATTPTLPDTTAPSVPGTPAATVISSSRIDLTWAVSTDSGGSLLAGYKVFRGGTQIATTTSASYSNTGLTASTLYCYTVEAYDNAGNTSVQSAQSCATTLAVTGTIPGTLNWVRNPGSQSGLNVNGIAADHSSNTVVAGTYYGTVDFGGVAITSPGGTSDGFVVKYNSAGVPVWAKTLGGTGNDTASAVAVDGQDNVIVTGNFYSLSVDLGGGGLTNVAGTSTTDAFVVKLSPSGQHVWSKRFGSLTTDTPTAVATDASGNVFVAAQCGLTVDFGSGITLTGAGALDIAVVKFSAAAGTTLWAKLRGGSSYDYATGLAMDRAGDIVVTGRFGGGDLGGGATASTGIFVAKYSGADGSYVWSRIPGGGTGTGYGITVDANTGIIIAAGNINGAADFGGGSISASGAFLAGYDGAGNYLWATQYSADAATAVASDANGIMAITGQASSLVNFGGGYLVGDGNPNYYVAAFNLSGNSAPTYRWAKRGTSGKTWGRALAFDLGGQLLTGGKVEGTGDLGGVSASGPIGFGGGFVMQYVK